MKQFLYVYVPGFEYDSKGPLHIDAIRLDVTVGELEKESNTIKNSIPTYIYIKGGLDKEGKLQIQKKIEGNTIYRIEHNASKTYENIIRGRYSCGEDESPASSVFWTQNIIKKDKEGELEDIYVYDRVLHGFFYDFITTPITDEKTHHIIGFHNSPNLCIENVSNLNSTEHDGLFAIQIEELNTELVFNFTFYSKINNCESKENKIIVGNYGEKTEMLLENSEAVFLSDWDPFFIQENRSDFFDKYVEIGKWSLTYNPATSGIDSSESFLTANFKLLYYDLKGNIDEWQVPVNAEFLVTDFSKAEEHKLPIPSGMQALAQYSYDAILKKHIYDETLPCNSYSDAKTFYNNFYPGVKDTEPYELDLGKTYNIDIGARVHKKRRRPSSACASFKNCATYLAASSNTYSINYDRSFTYCDLSNFNYLYRLSPKVTLVNVLNDQDLGLGDAGIPIIVGINTTRLNITEKIGAGSPFTVDCYNAYIDNGYAGETDNPWCYIGIRPWENGNYTIQHSPQLKIKTLIECSGASNIIPYSTQTIGLWYNLSSIQGWSSNSKILEDKVKKYHNSRPSKGGLFYTSFYSRSINESTASEKYKLAGQSILETGSYVYDLNKKDNKLYVKTEISNPQIPVLAIEGGIHYNGDWTSRDNTEKIIKDEAPTTCYNVLKNTFRNYNGEIFIALPWMYYIDLGASTTNIIYDNTSDYKIAPYLYNKDFAGYNKYSLVPTNINMAIGNLLDDNLESQSEFELLRIVPSKYIKYNTELKYSTDNKDIYIDSTFCNEERFIGITSNLSGVESTIEINKEISYLEPGFYVLKIQTMYPNLEELKDSISVSVNIGSNQFENIKGYNNKWAFSVKDSCKFILNSITKSRWSFLDSDRTKYDIISGIGLYKIDFSNKKNSITLVFEQAYDSYVENQTAVATFINPDGGYISLYNYIVFPAAFCAKEHCHFCNRLDNNYLHILGLDIYDNYKNDYCTSEEDDMIHHFYNFHYLPDKAIYDVLAYYTIPVSSNKIDVSEIEYINKALNSKLTFLGDKIIRI